jgi:hypothetical protein
MKLLNLENNPGVVSWERVCSGRPRSLHRKDNESHRAAAIHAGQGDEAQLRSGRALPRRVLPNGKRLRRDMEGSLLKARLGRDA